MPPPPSDSDEDFATLTIGELDGCSDEQLQAVIDRAQSILHDRHDPTEALEARPGEEILETHDHGAYTIVIVERTEADDPGPFMYRVQYEPEIDGDEGRFRWHFLGRFVD